jgi:diacylglycerol kinase family enzyme
MMLKNVLFVFFRDCATLTAVRAVALLGPIAKDEHVREFELPGVNIFTGNELDPTDQPDAALIFGGDGTMHRHIGVLSLRQVPMLIVPMGSANDFAKSIGIRGREESLAAWTRFCKLGDNVRTIDLGTIQPLRPNPAPEPGSNEPWATESLENLHFVPDGPRHDLPKLAPRILQWEHRRSIEAAGEVAAQTVFSCIAGTGLDAAANRRTLNQPRWLRGHGGYVFALLQVLAGFRPPHMHISAEVGGQWRTVADEPGMLIAVGNGPQYGDGMRLTHLADMDDGKLDVCFVRRLSKLRLLRLFHVVFSGGHIGMKEVEYLKTTRVRIVTDPVTELFADGEPVGQTPVEIGVRRGALRVITKRSTSTRPPQ